MMDAIGESVWLLEKHFQKSEAREKIPLSISPALMTPAILEKLGEKKR